MGAHTGYVVGPSREDVLVVLGPCQDLRECVHDFLKLRPLHARVRLLRFLDPLPGSASKR